MIVDQINLNQLRVFGVVYRLGSMTRAARELHLTQSGVSQHIKALENLIRVTLFDREARRLIPTPQAHVLYKQCHQGFHELETVLQEITGGELRLSGTVRVGMPPELGLNVLLPVVSKFLRQHDQVQVHCHFGLANQISHLLLEGELDFAYVDAFDLDKRISLRKVYDEAHELCASKRYLKKKGVVSHQRSFFEKLDFISYMEGEPLLRRWFRHHLVGPCPKLHVRAYTASPRAVLNLVLHDVGVGILPRHMIVGKSFEKAIACLPGSKKPLMWPIYVATLEHRTRSPVASALLETIDKSLNGGK